jgi:cold shock CspA family protein
VIGVDRGPGAGELGSRGRRGRAAGLFVALDQTADVFLHLSQVGECGVDPLEEGDDVTLHRLALGGLPHRGQASLDLLKLTPQGRERRLAHLIRPRCR